MKYLLVFILLIAMSVPAMAWTVDEVVYTEGRIWADGDAKPLWAVGLRTEVGVWNGLGAYISMETGQVTTEQSKMHTCKIWTGCSIEQMQNSVKEDDTYWVAKIGIQYRFNLLGNR